MSDVEKLDFNDDFLLDSAERRIGEGDYFGALTVLNKREEMREPLADAYALYADAYEGLELYGRAADAWFRFLDTCNEADFAEGYEGLAVAFMNLGNEVQSAFYYRRAAEEDEGDGGDGEIEFEFTEQHRETPHLRLIHAEGVAQPQPETIMEGLTLLKLGDLEGAKRVLDGVDEESSDYATAAGLSAMCTLMLGDEEGAERECEALIGRYPDNVQTLTTYCAVLGAREKKQEARAVAARLAEIETDSADDLYRIATALCETGLHEPAFRALGKLLKKLPLDENVLWFHAVSGFLTGRTDEAIGSLETLTTIFPRKAVARYYLAGMRRFRDGGEPVRIGYFYRLPEEEYRRIAGFLLKLNGEDDEKLEKYAATEEFARCFAIAFDEMEGRDEKLQMLAAKLAVHGHADALVRAVLLDYEGDDVVKLTVLHELVLRNEENSFGIVVCNLYREFFTHEIDLGTRKRAAFLQAFSDVYTKCALVGSENEGKLCAAAEDVYASLEEASAWELMEERSALAAAIYREARIRRGERGIGEIAKLFDADLPTVERILDYMM